MRRIVPIAALLAAGCASTPAPAPREAPSAPVAVISVSRHNHDTLDGMTANDLAEHFGRPRLQIREGDGTKLQFAGPGCVLDAYLYPPAGGQGVPRVSHVDTRNLQGGDVNTQACIASIEGR
jgi:hypothetical protein